MLRSALFLPPLLTVSAAVRLLILFTHGLTSFRSDGFFSYYSTLFSKVQWEPTKNLEGGRRKEEGES